MDKLPMDNGVAIERGFPPKIAVDCSGSYQFKQIMIFILTMTFSFIWPPCIVKLSNKTQLRCLETHAE